MKQVLTALIVVFLLCLLILEKNNSSPAQSVKSKQPVSESKNQNNMQLTSPAFQNNETIPQKYTCDGEGVNPALSISGIPENAKSLVLIVDDPDAPSGTFDHWIVYNIDPVTFEINEDSVPKNANLGRTSTGGTKYVAPCPPSGTHRYIFTLYALDQEKLSFESPPLKEEILNSMQNHIIQEAQLIGLYSR